MNDVRKRSNKKFAKMLNKFVEAPWYREFLRLPLREIENLPPASKILDVGTGPGKLLELIQKNYGMNCVGVDVDEAMLEYARQRTRDYDVFLALLEPNRPLPFKAGRFDAVFFCSVLFLLEEPEFLLNEACRVLKSTGKIVVLTPTGEGNWLRAFSFWLQIKFDLNNWSFFFWRTATARKAYAWRRKKLLSKYAEKNHFKYESFSGMNNFAVLEVLSG